MQSAAQQSAERKQTHDKLQVEIVNRIARAEAVVMPLLRKYSRALSAEEEGKNGSDVFIILSMLQAIDSQAFLSDFAGSNLSALVWQLRQQLKGGSLESERSSAVAMNAAISLKNKLELQWKPNIRCEIWNTRVQPVMTKVFTQSPFILSELQEMDALLKSVRALVKDDAPDTPGMPERTIETYTSFADYYCQQTTSHERFP